MLAKRIIPCLDVKDGQTVKGTNFVNLRQAGDPVELGRAYSEAGADELVFLDITASHEGRKTFTDMVQRVAAEMSIPFTVGGGISELADVERMLSAGADKVSINSAALRRPAAHRRDRETLRQPGVRGGHRCQRGPTEGWTCYLNGGRIPVERNLFDWAHEAQERGAGEILFTSMNHDGVKARLCQRCPAPTSENALHTRHSLGRSGRWSISATCSPKAMPMPHWQPACSTSARSASRNSKQYLERSEGICVEVE